jgi:pyruvate-formate lyase-activating enzyme
MGLLRYVDLVLYDLKHTGPAHRRELIDISKDEEPGQVYSLRGLKPLTLLVEWPTLRSKEEEIDPAERALFIRWLSLTGVLVQ